MTVVSVDRDLDELTLVLVAEFEAPVERVWQLWSDPRQLERWWGPPTYPATFTSHALTPGFRVEYHSVLQVSVRRTSARCPVGSTENESNFWSWSWWTA